MRAGIEGELADDPAGLLERQHGVGDGEHRVVALEDLADRDL